MKFNENNPDCLSSLDVILPYLMIACFLFGFFLLRNHKNENDTNNKYKRKLDKFKSLISD